MGSALRRDGSPVARRRPGLTRDRGAGSAVELPGAQRRLTPRQRVSVRRHHEPVIVRPHLATRPGHRSLGRSPAPTVSATAPTVIRVSSVGLQPHQTHPDHAQRHEGELRPPDRPVSPAPTRLVDRVKRAVAALLPAARRTASNQPAPPHRPPHQARPPEPPQRVDPAGGPTLVPPSSVAAQQAVRPSSLPGQPSSLPGQPSSLPGQPSSLHGQPSSLPGQPTRTPPPAESRPGAGRPPGAPIRQTASTGHRPAAPALARERLVAGRATGGGVAAYSGQPTGKGTETPALGAGIPLPDRFRGLAQAITGRRSLPRFTAGAATRRWLRASGARAAATGTTMHLPSHPGTGPSQVGAVAHELTHLAHRGGRPRFLLSRLPTAPDAEERLAQQVGEAARRLASQPAGRAADLAGRAGDLAGRAGDLAGRAGDLAGRAGDLAATGGDLAGRVADRAGRVPAAVRGAGLPALPVPEVPAGPGPLPVPYPSLPVAGVAGAAQLAREAARAAVAERLGAAAPTPPDQTAAPAGEALRGAAGSSGGRVMPALPPAPPGMAGGAAEHPAGPRSPARAAGRTPASPDAADTGASAAAGNPPAATDPAFDDLLDALEDRLLAELERRGGRYAGVF
jgi:hypothetical protein